MINQLYDTALIAFSDPIVLLLFAAVAVLWSTKSSSRYKRIPGPRGLPLIGNLLQWPTVKPWLAIDEWHKKYQSDIISVNLAGLQVVILGSMKRASDLHEKRSALYANRPNMTALVEIMNFEDCIFAFHQYGPQWRQYRKLFNDHFQAHVIPKYHPSMVREAHILAQQVLKTPEKILKHLRHVYPAILMDVTYGIRVAPDDDYFVSLAEEAMSNLNISTITGTSFLDIFPFMKYIPSWMPGAGFKRAAEHARSVNIAAAMKPWAATENISAPDSVVAKLLDQTGNDEALSRNTATTAYLAGSDTSVSTAQTLILALAMHPEVQKKAQKELDEVVGVNCLPTFEHSDQLPYLSAILKEAARWQTVAPFGNARRSISDDVYDGYFIPKGTIVAISMWSIHHDPANYPDPFTFNPDRFMKGGKLNPDVLDPTDVGFGLGRRVCPGRFFSNDALYITFATLLSLFEFAPPLGADGKPIALKAEMTTGIISAMDWSATVLSASSSDTEPTVVVTFDSAKYIFNAGENTNRAFLQSRRNWKRSRGLFFTSIGTERASGLAGLLMTLADATIPKLDIIGPPGTTHFLAAMRSYTFRDAMPVNPIEASLLPTQEHLYKDENITVYSIPITPSFSAPDDASTMSKRKRDASPSSPVKRARVEEGTPPKSYESLSEALDDPKLSPVQLEGPVAHEYRKLMVKTMFPASQKSSASTPSQKSGKKKGKATEIAVDTLPEVDIYRRPRIPTGFHQQLPRFAYDVPMNGPPTLAYIIAGPRIRGKFDVKRAEALGVPFGRLRGQLTKGQSVTFDVKVGDNVEKRTVRPEECVGESESPGVLIILDVPSPAYIPSLISSFTTSSTFAKFRSHLPEDAKEYNVRTVFHLCGRGVLEDTRYIEFMNGFSPDVHHVVSSKDFTADPVTFTSVAFNQLRLNRLDHEMFPLPHFCLEPRRTLSALPNLPKQSMPLKASLFIKMRPFSPPTVDSIYSSQDLPTHDLFHPAVTAQTSTNVPLPLPPSTLEKFEVARSLVDDSIDHIIPGSGTEKAKDVVVTPLGTGSALPTKYRNVSSTLIQIPKWGSILLDAGEGSWGQLVRLFGAPNPEHVGQDVKNVETLLRDLRCIFVSHIHGDHHMGVAKILAKRRQLDPPPTQPLYLVALRAVHVYLREYSDIEDLGLFDGSPSGVVTIMSESLHWKRPERYQTTGMWQLGGNEPWTDIQQSKDAAQGMYRSLGLKSFRTVDVYHRTRCYGAVIDHTDGWSIVFSGDTQPTQNLVWAGRGATLLIHEATMADNQEEMARKKAHSTFGQAVDIGKRMNAENILLTHFSARYPKLPPDALAPANSTRTPNGGSKEPIVALAFDHANIKIGDMWKLNHYMDAIQQCLKDSSDDGDEEETTLESTEVDIS
ncbi:hypothetical protein EYR40_009650 [Pleurotus pulmonarius]|nr:hypothetical protein EYR40_009650 [Pleurotus pulmonarius]